MTGNAVLIAAHPGHELRVHHWLELAKPTVLVLTDGSGRTQRSRLPSTSRVLAATGASSGAIYGWCSDAALYAALLAGDDAFFRRLLHALVERLRELRPDCLVADALEGFNPSHDVCRFLVNVAASIIRQETGRGLANFDFVLDGDPAQCPASLRERAVRVDLSDAALTRKLAAAEGYPELRAETASALARYGSQPFRTEYLRPVDDEREGLDRMPEEPPFYERVGEQQVGAGHYPTVIRYHEHVKPLINALWQEAGLSPAPSGAAR